MQKLNSKSHLLVTPLFTILLSSPGIASADAGTLQFGQATFDVHENDKTAMIEVTRLGGSDGKVSVKCTTSDGTATASSDYQAISGKVLKWADGDTTPKTCKVKIINDKVFNEGYETVNLTLSDPTGGASLGGISDATLNIADNDCGTDNPDDPLPPHWVDTCPSGFDGFPTIAIINIAFGYDENPVMGRTDCSHEDPEGVYKITLQGPTLVFRGDGTNSTTPHSIQTEMYDLEMSGNTPFGPVTLYAGDGVGNLADDGPIAPSTSSLYSPGEIEENSSEPGKANSSFEVNFELHTPIGILHNNGDYHVQAIDLLGVPPVPLKHTDGTLYKITYLHPTEDTHVILTLYNEANEPTACFKVKEIGEPSVKHLSVNLKSFTASVNNGVVSVAWETGTETNNAAFRVLRGIPLTGICSDNPNDYTEIETVGPRIFSKGTERSGAVYSELDENVISGTTYCYALEDIDYNDKSTFHTDQIVSVTVN